MSRSVNGGFPLCDDCVADDAKINLVTEVKAREVVERDLTDIYDVLDSILDRI